MYTALIIAIQLGAVTSNELASELTTVTETVEAIELAAPKASDRWAAAPVTVEAV